MSRSPKQPFLDLTCGLVESRSLAQFQERTESILTRLFDADHVAFCQMHPDLPTGFEWRASTTGHFLQSYYQWYQDDFVFQSLSRNPNTAWSDLEMLRGRKLHDTETWRRSRESSLDLRHVLAVLLMSEHQVGSGAVALYSDRVRAFSATKQRLLQQLTPALSGAFQNFARFGALSAHGQLMEELLRQEGAHAIVLDARRRECFRTGAVTSLLERWFPSRSDRDEGGLPRAWRERMDAFLAGSALVTSTPLVWREERGNSSLEARFTRLPRIEGRDLWELQLKELHALPEAWRRILTPKQFEVATLIAQGLSNQDIATALAIKEGTVKDHVEAAFERLNVTSGRTGLLALARRS